jgi:CheY-like chemotaxis protein
MVAVAQDITRRHQAEQRILKLNAQLEQRVDSRTQELADTLAALRERESAVLRESAINQGVASVASAIISLDRELPEIARIVLEEASRLTGCRTGFVAEKIPDTDARRILSVSPKRSSDTILNTEQRALLDAAETLLVVSNQYREGSKGFFTNRPSRHPMFSAGLAPDSVGLSSFLSVPAIVGGEILGELCLANKSGGFSDRDLHVCEKLADLFALAIAHIRRAEELESTKNAAEAASQAKSQFLSTMSHELRSPLNVIIGLTDVLSDSCRDEQQRGHISSIHSASASLLRLVNEVLDLARIEAGRVEIETLPVDIVQLVNDVCGVFETSASQKGLVLSAEIAPNTPLLCLGDVNRLRQILVNLVSNAVKFTPAGKITLKVSAVPASNRPNFKIPVQEVLLRFSVLDTGIGIPEDRLESIFEGFTQVDASVARRFGGSGLGLAIARNLADLFGGKLTVQSTLGRGSRFELTVPLAMATGPCRQLNARSEPSPSKSRRTQETASLWPIRSSRVLLVEDSEDNQRVISAFLENTAAKLDIASNGFDAFKLFERTRYSLVLMDIQMPLLDGLATTRLLRQWELHSGIRRTPIVALSAHAVSGAFEQALAVGCDDYLSKPIHKDSFWGAISRYLGQMAPHRNSSITEPSTTSTGVPQNTGDEEELDIKTDPVLVPHLEEFLRSVSQSLSDIHDLLEQGDYQRIAAIGHKLKGDGGTYGLGKVSELGKAFQLAAGSASASAIELHASALLDFVDKVAARRGIRLQ